MSRSPRRPALVAGGVVLAAVAVVTALQLTGDDDSSSPSPVAAATASPGASSSTPSSPAAVSSISTPSSPAAVSSISTPSPGQEVGSDPSPVRTGGEVDPVVTYAAWEDGSSSVEVNGYVAGVVEADGTCRLTLTRGSQTVVDENPAEADASTVNCGLLQAAGADLEAGTWTAVLSYESATSSGTSPAVDVEVPAR
jgi:hypothetical protein